MPYEHLLDYATGLSLSMRLATKDLQKVTGSSAVLLGCLGSPVNLKKSSEALRDLSTLCATLASEVRGWTEGAGREISSMDRLACLQMGLLARVADDLRALDLLWKGGCERQAAALSRSTYESLGWLELVSSEPGDDAAEVYWFFHERDSAAASEHFWEEQTVLIQRLLREAAAEGNVIPLFLAQLEERLKDASGEIREEVAALGRRLEAGATARMSFKDRNKLYKAGIRRTYDGVGRSLRQSPNPMQDFWSTMVYDPSCRILHASDALDYVNVPLDGGRIELRPSPAFPQAPQRPAVVVHAVMLRALEVIADVGTLVVEVVESEDPDDIDSIEAVAEERQILGILSGVVSQMHRSFVHFA